MTLAEFKATRAATITERRSPATPVRADQEDQRPEEPITCTERLTSAVLR